MTEDQLLEWSGIEPALSRTNSRGGEQPQVFIGCVLDLVLIGACGIHDRWHTSLISILLHICIVGGLGTGHEMS